MVAQKIILAIDWLSLKLVDSVRLKFPITGPSFYTEFSFSNPGIRLWRQSAMPSYPSLSLSLSYAFERTPARTLPHSSPTHLRHFQVHLYLIRPHSLPAQHPRTHTCTHTHISNFISWFKRAADICTIYRRWRRRRRRRRRQRLRRRVGVNRRQKSSTTF